MSPPLSPRIVNLFVAGLMACCFMLGMLVADTAAALYLGKPVATAIKTACELSVYCEEPIKVYHVSREAQP